MKKYELKYWYMAQGMDFPDEYPLKTIYANSQSEAIYKYHSSNGIDFGTFEEFMERPLHVREWGITCKKIT